MKLIVGLGNPGATYQRTRHNVGCLVLDRLRQPLPAGVTVAYGDNAWLLKPGVFMNTSGATVRRMALKHAVPPADILVVCDDLALPLGQLRVRGEGSAGGHRGLESIIQQFGTTEFPRVRVGIGAPPAAMDPAEFVLREFTDDEWQVMAPAIASAAQCVEVWMLDGLTTAMNRFNRMRPRLAEPQ